MLYNAGEQHLMLQTFYTRMLRQWTFLDMQGLEGCCHHDNNQH